MSGLRIGGLFLALALAACGPLEPPQRQLGPDGQPLPSRYNIKAADHDAIQLRMLDGVNALRQARGLATLQMDARLNAAAATHAHDMSRQNRPWHFGSDGSSPLDRLMRVGYPGKLTGEVISETYETELETLSAWMQKPDTKAVILDPDTRAMGFEWVQEANGKIWWTMVLAQ